MKRSRTICLSLLASLSLVACGSDEEPTQRAAYMNLQDCAEDWGGIDDCDNEDGRWLGPHYYYLGGRPHYYSKKKGTAMAVPSTSRFSRVTQGTTSPKAMGIIPSSVSRGGFGKSSSSHSVSS